MNELAPLPLLLGAPLRPKRAAATVGALVAGLVLLATPPAAAQEPVTPGLHVELGRTAAITGAALTGVVAAEIWKSHLVPSSCRVCEPTRFDSWTRDALVWSTPSRAAAASNVTAVGVPLLTAGAVAMMGYDAAGSRRALEDVLVISEAVSLTMLGTQIVKFSVGRLRPYAYVDPSLAKEPESLVSFWSGHTAAAFSGAAAAGQVARMRGYRGWPWIMSLGLAGAGACGYFRVAADKHWATDVLAAAGAGTVAGLGLPLLLHGREASTTGLQATVLPAGFAGSF